MAYRHHLEALVPSQGDGIRTDFVTSTPYQALTFTGVVRGIVRVGSNDDGFLELSPTAGTVRFKEPPALGDDVMGAWLELAADVAVEELLGTIGNASGQLSGALANSQLLNASIANGEVLAGAIERLSLAGSIADAGTLSAALED